METPQNASRRDPAATATPPSLNFSFPSSSAPTDIPAESSSQRRPSPQPNGGSARHNQMKRFARSADKRQSVHMLGSIQHLQHHFTKFGLESAERNDAKPGSKLASGSLALIPSEADGYPNETETENVHQTPSAPATVPKPPFPLFETPKVDQGKLKSEALEGLRQMEVVWRTGRADDATRGNEVGIAEEPVKILDLLKVTVDAVRAVRSWALAVPASALARADAQHGFIPSGSTKQRVSTFSTPSRPGPKPSARAVSGSGMVVGGSGGMERDTELGRDPLSDLRKVALDVLVCLRGVEERFRDEVVDTSFEDDEADSGPPEPDVAVNDEPTTTPPKQTPSHLRDTDPEVEDDWFFSERLNEERPEWTEDEKKSWYERLASGHAGWVYRDDVTLGRDLQDELEVVERYMDVVNETFFGGKRGADGQRPWRIGQVDGQESGEGARDVFGDTVVPAGGALSGLNLKEKGTDVQGPDWAREELWDDEVDKRSLTFMRVHLPVSLAAILPPAESKSLDTQLLTRLSDGYLLIRAFNTVLSQAAGSWGFVPEEDVHDTLSLSVPGDTAIADTDEGDESGKRPRDWTFRKAGNLRCWGAALKLRYNVPLVFPVSAVDTKPTIPLIQTTPEKRTDTSSRQVSPVPSRRPSSGVGVGDGVTGDGIPFDPVRIARREEGWDGTLRRVVAVWIDRVAREMRSEEGAG